MSLLWRRPSYVKHAYVRPIRGRSILPYLKQDFQCRTDGLVKAKLMARCSSSYGLFSHARKGNFIALELAPVNIGKTHLDLCSIKTN